MLSWKPAENAQTGVSYEGTGGQSFQNLRSFHLVSPTNEPSGGFAFEG